MTNPLSSLVQEHRTIARLSDALGAYADQLLLVDSTRPNAPALDSVPPADLGRFAEVFRELVDLMHHEKEESVLLPFVVEKGFDWDWGTVPEIRREHRHERYLIEVLCQASARDGDWSLDDRRRIAETAHAIVEFERGHLAKENKEFFPKVLADLDETAQRELAGKLSQFDEQRDQHDRSVAMKRLATDLIDRYAPASSAPPSVAS